MRTLLLAISIATMMSMVGVYSMSIVDEPGVLGGGGSSEKEFSGSHGETSLTWTVSDGKVTGADVTWTPSGSGEYTVTVTVGNSVGRTTVTSSGKVERTDTVTISPAVDVQFVTTAKVTTHKS